MSRKVICFFIFILIMIGSVATITSEPVSPAIIAVMDIETGAGVENSLAIPITMVVMEELTSSGAYRVMDRARRDEILKEKGFKFGECHEADCYLRAGKLLGVSMAVTGRIDKVGASYLLALQRVNIETGIVEAAARESVAGDATGLVNAAAAAAKKLTPQKSVGTKSVLPPPPTAPARVGTCPDGMVYIPDGDFCIDRFEYPDRKGEIPKDYVNASEAVDLCRKVGKRLPTESEFEAACAGSLKLPFGYGEKYKKGVCNIPGGVAHAKVLPAGSLESCANDYGVFDMIGNMWEWVESGSKGRQVLKGGSYMSTMPAFVTCGDRLDPQEQQGIGWGRGYDFGFRCAKDAE